MAIQDWSPTAADNTSIGAINIAEGCPSANLNNAIRELMAQMAVWFQNTGYQPYDDTLQSLSGIVGRNNALPIFNGVAGLELADISAFMRLLLLASDGPTVCQSIGAVRVAALSLGNPGYIRFQVGASSYFQIAWGTAAAVGDSYVTVGYPANFTSFSIPIISGTSRVTNGAEQGSVVTSASVSGFTFYTAEGSVSNTGPAWWIAVGV